MENTELAQSNPEKKPVRSYACSNLKLAEAFDRYQMARGQSATTLRAYHEAVAEFVASLGSESAVEADRTAIRRYQTALLERGVHENTIRLRTGALRQFFKFLAASGLTRGLNPTLLLSYRKVPSRVPRVLTIAEVKKLISAAERPVEAAIVEVLYATGVRVSELVNLRLADVDFSAKVSPYSLRVKNGKGGKDRVVMMGEKAMHALRRYLFLTTKPHQTEFLFEVAPGLGTVHKNRDHWVGGFAEKTGCRVSTLYIGKISALPSPEDAMRVLRQLLEKEPGFRPGPARPYTTKGIRLMVGRLAARAGIGHTHPHALRRALATHMLESGADLRCIQELLGHVNLTTTMRYTSLSPAKLKEVYDHSHPHAKEAENAEEN
jgi:site-specific recombinase XerD